MFCNGPAGLGFACMLACSLGILTPQIARADGGEASKSSPRNAIAIGGASLVLVSANDHLYAFIDRIENNAPVANAELRVATTDGTALHMSQAADGLFVAPFNRAGRVQDAFAVTLRSAAGSGEAFTKIVYDDRPDPNGGEAPATIWAKLAVALVAGSIGAIATASAMLWQRGDGRRPETRSPGPARAA